MKTEKQVRTWWIETRNPSLYENVFLLAHEDASRFALNQKAFPAISHEDYLAIVARLENRIEKLREALKFYSLKSNYSIVDEARDYIANNVVYELNENTYADEELGTKARQALAEDEK